MSKNLHGNSSVSSLFLPQVRHYDKAVQPGWLLSFINIPLLKVRKYECKAFFFFRTSCEMCCCCRARGLFTAWILWAGCFGWLGEVTKPRATLTNRGWSSQEHWHHQVFYFAKSKHCLATCCMPKLHFHKRWRNKSTCLAVIIDMYWGGFLKGWSWAKILSWPQWLKKYHAAIWLGSCFGSKLRSVSLSSMVYCTSRVYFGTTFIFLICASFNHKQL